MKKKYIYLNKEYAKKGIVNIFQISVTAVEDYKKIYRENAIEYYGDFLPHYITYEENLDLVREATDREKVERGSIKLGENQVLMDNQIININPQTQFIFEGRVINAPNDHYIYIREENKWIIDIESTEKKQYMLQVTIANLELEIETNKKRIPIFIKNNFSIKRLKLDIKKLEDEKNKIFEIYGKFLTNKK